MRPTPRQHRLAFTLAEAIVCTVIVATMFLAAMTAAGAARKSNMRVNEQAIAHNLADSLMAEIVALPFEDPSETPVLGLELTEQLSTRRNQFDDVDDFNGWTASPPQRPDGSAIPGMDGWTRSVQVVHINPKILTQVSPTLTGAKRITVTVQHTGSFSLSVVAVRTNVR